MTVFVTVLEILLPAISPDPVADALVAYRRGARASRWESHFHDIWPRGLVIYAISRLILVPWLGPQQRLVLVLLSGLTV